MIEKKSQLQARIYWRCLSWFKALKWPSAHEIDFGDFLVDFDFKKGAATIRHLDGSARELATFEPQKRTVAVNAIQGQIRCGEHTLQLASPFVISGGVVQLAIASESVEDKSAFIRGDLFSSLSYGEAFCITPKTEGRDVFLSVDFEPRSQDLAVFVASLLIFCRFTEAADGN